MKTEIARWIFWFEATGIMNVPTARVVKILKVVGVLSAN
jgi:hypothetical protein